MFFFVGVNLVAQQDNYKEVFPDADKTEFMYVDGDAPDFTTFCFYYNWYGNVKNNGKDIHWAHPVMKSSPSDTTSGYLPGGDNIATNFFPELGTYSCTDTVVISRHIQMLKQAKIEIIVLTWWNIHDFGYQSVPLIMDEAAKNNLKVCFHIEPFSGRNALTTRENMVNIIDRYENHPAFYRLNGKPLFFIYDSYLTKAEEWASLLRPEGKISVRNTLYDAIMIGLWVKKGEETFFETSGFDGFYTYFGATGFTYGSSPENWMYLQQWADKNKKIFIPCVGPGYIDTRVRPWNTATTRDRENGAYYDRMFQAVEDCGSKFAGITSFNEWHEGTQIEPAVTFESDFFNYLDYSPLSPDYYLRRTGYWIEKLQNK
ncbi:MAG: alpha-mannosidase [Dysgonamonadaceae bacterium]|nr:alpha-mannosidase [Dysgonamonadaceae bacterium]